MRHESKLMQFVSLHGVFKFPVSSLLGQNAWFCMQRFECGLSDAISSTINSSISKFVEKSFDDSMHYAASFLVELLLVMDNISSVYTTQAVAYLGGGGSGCATVPAPLA